MVPVHDVDDNALLQLAEAAIEPNAYHLAEWLKALSASARARSDIDMLCAWQSRPGVSPLAAAMPRGGR